MEEKNVTLEELLNDNNLNSSEYIESNIIDLDVDNLKDIVINKSDFNDGVKDMSRLCGQISALCAVGITPSMALSYISEKYASDEVNKYNLKISELNANSNIESSKFGAMSVQKYSI